MSTRDGISIGRLTVAGISEGGTGNILAPLDFTAVDHALLTPGKIHT